MYRFHTDPVHTILWKELEESRFWYRGGLRTSPTTILHHDWLWILPNGGGVVRGQILSNKPVTAGDFCLTQQVFKLASLSLGLLEFQWQVSPVHFNINTDTIHLYPPISKPWKRWLSQEKRMKNNASLMESLLKVKPPGVESCPRALNSSNENHISSSKLLIGCRASFYSNMKNLKVKCYEPKGSHSKYTYTTEPKLL